MKKFLLSLNLIVWGLGANIASAQFTNGAMLLTEGYFPNTSGQLYFYNTKIGYWNSSKTYAKVNGYSTGCFGETSQYATIWGDYIYVMSKQTGSYSGGLLEVGNATTWERVKVFTKFSDDGNTYDGRGFFGVSESKAYIGTSNGIFVYDIENKEIGKLIEGTENSDSGAKLYSGQIGSMVRVGSKVFAVKQNVGIYVINVETDEIENTISSQKYGSFTDLVVAKDGTLWTGACSKENSSFMDSPEQPYLIKIDPYSLKTIEITITNPIRSPWSTWRFPYLQACSKTNRLIWPATYPADYSNGVRTVCYYDIDKQKEGILCEITDVDVNSIYTGVTVDHETDNVYVIGSEGASSGPYYLYIVDGISGEFIGDRKNTPLTTKYGDWPAMMLTTDDYAPVIDIETISIAMNETCDLPLVDFISDQDNIASAIISEITKGTDENIAIVSIEKGVLKVTPVKVGETTFELKAMSNGKVTLKTINVVVSVASGINDIMKNENVPIEYFTLQGVRISADEIGSGIYIKKQGNNITKIINK